VAWRRTADEHVSTIVPEKPPCAGNVKTSFTCPALHCETVAQASVKSGGEVTVTVTNASLS